MRWTEEDDRKIAMMLEGISILAEETGRKHTAIINRMFILQSNIASVERMHSILDDLGLPHDVHGLHRKGKVWWLWIKHDGKPQAFPLEEMWKKREALAGAFK